jgi:hypothetical protein
MKIQITIEEQILTTFRLSPRPPSPVSTVHRPPSTVYGQWSIVNLPNLQPPRAGRHLCTLSSSPTRFQHANAQAFERSNLPSLSSSIIGLFLDFKNSKTIQFKCPKPPLPPPLPRLQSSVARRPSATVSLQPSNLPTFPRSNAILPLFHSPIANQRSTTNKNNQQSTIQNRSFLPSGPFLGLAQASQRVVR